MKRKRIAPGSCWRVLAQGPRSQRFDHREDGGAIFDELVIDDWFHIEQMYYSHWWMRVGTGKHECHFAISRDTKGEWRISLTEGALSK